MLPLELTEVHTKRFDNLPTTNLRYQTNTIDTMCIHRNLINPWWWHHAIEKLSALQALIRSQWRGTMMFALILTPKTYWTNSNENVINTSKWLEQSPADYWNWMQSLWFVKVSTLVRFDIQRCSAIKAKKTERLSALLQLHLHSRPNTWLYWVGQKQLQDYARNN